MSLQGAIVDEHSTTIFGWLPQTVAVTTLWATFAGWFPYAIAAIPIIYYCIMIWETKTVVHIRSNWRTRCIARQYIRLKAREKITLAKLEAIELLHTARVAARETVHRAEHEADVLVVKNDGLGHARLSAARLLDISKGN